MLGADKWIWLGRDCDTDQLPLFCWNLTAKLKPATSGSTTRSIIPYGRGQAEQNMVTKLLQNLAVSKMLATFKYNIKWVQQKCYYLFWWFFFWVKPSTHYKNGMFNLYTHLVGNITACQKHCINWSISHQNWILFGSLAKRNILPGKKMRRKQRGL